MNPALPSLQPLRTGEEAKGHPLGNTDHGEFDLGTDSDRSDVELDELEGDLL